MQHRNHVITLSSIFLGLSVAAPAGAASLTKVNDWGASGVPSYSTMNIYVPDKMATKPPILVSAHSCGSNAQGQMGNIPKIKAAADANGFILILPDNPGQNCWDVGAANSLKHDGGGDTQAIAQMVKYALNKYNGDPKRVYVMGGSSGAMLTQALMAVYPDVFVAGSARAGVPAGCWADGYASSNQWSDKCAGGQTSKTAMAWGDQARAMYGGYTGHRPRIQIIQGDADQTISFKNSAEAIKQWTNVLMLSETPSSTDMLTTSVSTYSRQFWKNTCGYVVFETWAGKNGGHSMGYEEDAILKFFGLDKADGPDPELAACEGGTGGTGGTGMGGASSSGGSGGMVATNGGTAGSTTTTTAGSGGVPTTTGGSPTSAGTSSGVAGSSGSPLPSTGGAAGTATVAGGSGGASSGSPTAGAAPAEDSLGCACRLDSSSRTSGSTPAAAALVVALGLVSRRRRRAAA